MRCSFLAWPLRGRPVVARALATFVLVVLAALPTVPAFAQGATIIYRFKGAADGAGPVGRMVAKNRTVLFGTTNQGGDHGMGTIFSLTYVNHHWVHHKLYSFAGGSDGAFPEGDLAISKGIVYGTTTQGGVTSARCEGGCGTVFRFTPNAKATGGSELVIHKFGGGPGGKLPIAGVIFHGGKIYGTTTTGGTRKGFGTVFRMTPKNAAKTAWKFDVLYAFKGGTDGGTPNSEVAFQGGELFGLTTREGIKSGQCSQDSRGCGTAFKLTPTKSGAAPWPETVLYRFKGSNDGMEPSGPLTIGTGPLFYGTTHLGGSANLGTVFVLHLSANRKAMTEHLIFQFTSPDGGKDPQGVVFLRDSLVGVTATDLSDTQAGTVYELDPPGPTWSLFPDDQFTGSPDGKSPSSRLLPTGNDIYYGVTTGGGNAGGNGTVFKLSFRPL